MIKHLFHYSAKRRRKSGDSCGTVEAILFTKRRPWNRQTATEDLYHRSATVNNPSQNCPINQSLCRLNRPNCLDKFALLVTASSGNKYCALIWNVSMYLNYQIEAIYRNDSKAQFNQNINTYNDLANHNIRKWVPSRHAKLELKDHKRTKVVCNMNLLFLIATPGSIRDCIIYNNNNNVFKFK